jgi:hypothetical protein
MKSWLGCIGLVAVAVATSVACSEDNGGSGGTGGTGGTGTGGAGGSGGASGGEMDASTCPGAEDGGGDDGGGADGGDLGPGTTKGCVTIYEADKIPYTASTVPVYTCNSCKSTVYPTGTNSCRNTSDCSIINTGMVRELVRNCALPCRQFEPAPGIPESDRIMKCNEMADCNFKCVKMATNNLMPPGLTDACGKCYTDVALCSISECLQFCAANADAIDCIKCQFEKGCRVPYERCSGLDRQL